MSVPQYVTQRLMSIHPTPHAVPKSTPVLAFGNFVRAEVATLGLNPSRLEFVDRNGQLLTGPSSRLASLQTLGIARLDGGTAGQHKQIFESCICYFQKKPY